MVGAKTGPGALGVMNNALPNNGVMNLARALKLEYKEESLSESVGRASFIILRKEEL